MVCCFKMNATKIIRFMHLKQDKNRTLSSDLNYLGVKLLLLLCRIRGELFEAPEISNMAGFSQDGGYKSHVKGHRCKIYVLLVSHSV